LFPVLLSVFLPKIRPLKAAPLVLSLCFLLSCAPGGAQDWTDESFRAYYLGLKALESGEPGETGETGEFGRGVPESAGAEGARAYFEAALKSSNPYVSNGAAEQLILPLLRGDAEDLAGRLGAGLAGEGTGGQSAGAVPRSLAAAALYRLGRYAEIATLYGDSSGAAAGAGAASAESGAAESGSLREWDGLFPVLARLRLADDGAAGELRDFLFGAAPGQSLGWAADEIRRSIPDFLSGTEDAVLDGRLATARSSFEAGLALFRAALEAQPGLFQRYPALLTDLGRCFQFTASGNEGVDVFLEWERGAPSASLRYRLLYFAGRIARARADYNRSRELFTQALAFVPDDLQEDACVWYIMDTALRDAAADPAALVATWAPRWNDPPYFDDILDRVAWSLASSGQWRRFPEVLTRLHDTASRASIAKYAYISGRALALGLIPAEGDSGGGDPREAALPYFRLAYDAGEGALYYRALSAYFLGEPFLNLKNDRRIFPGGLRGRGKTASALAADYPRFREMEFILGFFDADLPDQALPWIETMTEGLSTGELRVLAEIMETTGAHAAQIRLVSTYMDRDDYEISRRDLELLSPRAFQKLVEEEARRAGLAPELLYGLIRTESAFQPEIVSWAGAVGLTQLMPATAADMAGRIRARGGPNYAGDMAANLRDPEINVRVGAYYLAYLRDLIDHPLLSVLAYNGGMNRVRRWYREAAETFTPPLPGDLFLETIELAETRNYGRKVVSAALVYGWLYYDVKTDGFLADICR
jgi:soluble lytic murein transglycosylase